MKLLKVILLTVIGLVVLLALVGLVLPNTAHVERSQKIEAPASTVFTLVNGFNMFNKWSPWADRDPETKYVYEGPDYGVGAKMSWSSEDPNVGKGSQEIIESTPFEEVKTALDFGPNGTAVAFYKIEPEEGGCRITWGFDTEFGMNLIGRYFGLFMDSMLGKDYEQGLNQLKELAESLPKTDFSGLKVETVEVTPIDIAYASASSATDATSIGAAIGGAYGTIIPFLAMHGLAQAGAPLTISTSKTEDRYEFDAGIPIDKMPEGELPEDSPVKIGQTTGGKSLKIVHQGSYLGLSNTHEQIAAYLEAHGLEERDRKWEQYMNDPGSTAEEDLITHIYVPIN